MNKVILTGRLTKDPELRYTATTNVPVTRLSIAVQNGSDKPALFFNIVAWKNNADYITKYFKKGNKIGIQGRLNNREYQDKDGNNKQITEVIVEEILHS